LNLLNHKMFIKLLPDNLVHNNFTFEDGIWITDPEFNETAECSGDHNLICLMG